MNAKKTLVAPLHWGLGHATRSIPIIEAELANGYEVLVAATGGPRALLQKRFPEIEFVEIPFMEITYPKDENMARHFAFNGFKLLWNIWKEHRFLQKLVEQKKIDRVISDSRFGLFTKKVSCYFVSHQIEIQAPIFQGLINWLNRWVMNQYNQVWIPDYETSPGLAGKLSHANKMPKRYQYIGPLSRFSKAETEKPEPVWDAVAIVSGPEPQRTLFEADLTRRFIESDEKALLIQGKPHQPKEQKIDHLTILNHLDDEALKAALLSAKTVISRSGYSSIMDYEVLGIKAEFHPTPGQTEQEYLAELHQNK